MTLQYLTKTFIQENPKLFVAYLAIVSIYPVRFVLLPHLIGRLYKLISSRSKFVTQMIALIAGIIVFTQVMSIFAENIEIQIFLSLQKHIRDVMIQHVFDAHAQQYDELEVGHIISRIGKVPSIFYNLMDDLKNIYVPNGLTIVSAAIYFIFIAPKLGTYFALLTLVTLLSMYYIVRKCVPIAQARDNEYQKMIKNVDDVLKNKETVMTFDQSTSELDKLTRDHSAYADLTRSSFRCALSNRVIIIPLFICFVLYVLYNGYSQIRAHRLDTSVFITIMIILFLCTNIVFNMLSQQKDLVARMGIMRSVMEDFAVCTPQRQPYNKPPSSPTGITIQDVTFVRVSPHSDIPSRTIFNGLNLHIRDNETTVIVGEIGSGKSTLLRLIMKRYQPNTGELFLNGKAYSSISEKEMHRQIMYIPQTPILLNRSVYENIVYGLDSNTNTSRDRIMGLLHELNFQKFLEVSTGKWLDMPAGINGSALSGGQRQIVWLLKAILANPPVLVLDEPTASIDNSSKRIVQHLINNVMSGRMVIMVTHDENLLQYADRVITLQDGKVLKDVKPHSSKQANQEPATSNHQPSINQGFFS